MSILKQDLWLLRIFRLGCSITAFLLNFRCEGDVMVQELAPLHHHLTDGLLVIGFLGVGLNILCLYYEWGGIIVQFKIGNKVLELAWDFNALMLWLH